jgi:hypothetical protein
MFLIRLSIAWLMTVAFAPGVPAAQFNRDSGEYVILSAQYGTERHHVDVTERLKEFARRNRAIRIESKTFGIDPDPNQSKVLRIYARGPNGGEQMFEYREGSAVDGSQFRGWSRGDWGAGGWSGNWQGGRDTGEYVILSAQYGTERRHVDVTDRLKEFSRRDRTISIDNKTFGIDPDPNKSKVLRIYARGPNGGERMFEYREGGIVDGSQFRGWSRGDWGKGGWSGNWESGRDTGEYVILSAQYGTERRHVDVTDRLKEFARRDLTVRISNDIFGSDPDPNKSKVLRIYARGPNGGEQMFEYREGGAIDGSQFRGWGRGDWGKGGWSGNWESGRDTGEYVILSAQYGTERRHVDVTDRLKEFARRDLSVRISNNIFGRDPDPNQSKVLRIYARGPNGGERMFEYPEGGAVDGSQFRGWGRGDWGKSGWSGNWESGRDAGEYVILSAQYGTERQHVDVTARLRELARRERTILADNNNFGPDPDPRNSKVLRIYARGPNGGEQMFEYREGSAVDGSQFRGWGRGDWGTGGWSGRWEGQRK